jgi:hypothetical protein
VRGVREEGEVREDEDEDEGGGEERAVEEEREAVLSVNPTAPFD